VTKVHLLPEAEDDISEAAGFYNDRVDRLGDRFVTAVEVALLRVGENPHEGPEADKDVRKLRVKRFPYNLIYRILPSHVLVLAVAHHRRRPTYWRNRG
jgi:toxin ParE1/3/4